jgi:hypothetical protein
MRNFPFFPSMFLLLLVWSCETTLEENPPLVLSGEKWSLQEATLNGRGIASLPGGPANVPVSIDGSGEAYNLTVEFNEMNQLVTAEGSFVFDVNLSALGIPVGGEKIPVQGVEIFSGTWELINDQLLITDLEEGVTLDIVEYSDTMLHLEGVIDAADFERFQVEGLTVTQTNIEIILVR